MNRTRIERPKTLTLNLSLDEMATLERLARARGVNKSVLLRELIRRESAGHGEVTSDGHYARTRRSKAATR